MIATLDEYPANVDDLGWLWEPDRVSPLAVARVQQFPECHLQPLMDLRAVFDALAHLVAEVHQALQELATAIEEAKGVDNDTLS